MKRSCLALFVFLLAGAASLRADQITAAVQEALKENGFYYGEVNGQKTEDTTAAIRRYQIRNGLQITGEIDAETLRSLGVGPGAVRSMPKSEPTATPQDQPAEEGDDEPPQSAEIYPQGPPPNYGAPPGPGQDYGAGRRNYHTELDDVLAGTPYAIAPPDLQRHVVVGAQTLLTRFGYYRSGIDGVFGPGTANALRRFQAQAGLPPDGRLNMETLAALGLLPGQHGPNWRGQPRWLRPRPVYRGQPVPYP